MDALLSQRYVRRARSASGVLGVIVLLGGLLVLVGWVLEVDVLKGILPGLVTMKPNTAIAFALVGLSLLLLQSEGSGSWKRAISTLCSVAAGVIGLLVISEYLAGWDLHIDQLLFRDAQVGPVPPGRMAFSTAVGFVLIGSSLLLLAVERLRSFTFVVQVLAVAVAVLSLLALLGYVYGVRDLYDAGPYSAMALHTAALFALLSGAVLFSRPEKGFTAVAVSTGAAGLAVRRLLPETIVLQAVVGWLILMGQLADLYDDSFALALLVTANIVVVSILIFRSAWKLNQADILRLMAQDERSRADDGLGQSERRYRALIENSRDAVTLTDSNGIRTYVSPAVERLLGRASEELVGRSVLELLHPEDWEGAAGRNAATPEEAGGVDRFEFRLRHQDGAWRWFEGVRTNLLNDPDVQAVVTNWHDITERKLAEEKLRESERRFRELFENAAEAVFVTSLDGRLLTINPAGANIFGYGNPDEMVESLTSMEAVWADTGGRTRHVEAIRQNGRVSGSEVLLQRRDGSPIWMSVSASRVMDSGGEFIAMQSIGLDITERKLAEAKLRESEELFSSQFQVAGIGLAITSPEKAWIRVNQRLSDLLGYDEAELRNKTWAEMTHPEDLERDLWEFGRVLSGEMDSYSLDKRFVRKDGGVVATRLTVGCVRSDGGDVKYLIASIEDIAERKKTEAALESREAYLKAIMNNVPYLMWLKDADGVFLAVNSLFAQSCGKEVEGDVVGKTDLDVWPVDLASKYRSDDVEVMATLKQMKVEEQIADQSTIKWFETFKTPILDQNGQLMGTTGIAQDITERKRAEEALRESEARLLEAQRIGGVGNWDWDTQTGELYWSGENYRIYGIDPDAKPSVEAFLATVDPVDLDFVKQAMEEAFSGRRPYDLDMRIIRPDGSRGVVHAQAEVTFDATGKPVRMFGTVQDVTERKHMEERLLRGQRLEMAGRIAGQVAHDFNNLLSPLVAYPELLKMQLPEGHDGARLCDTMSRAARQMADINDDLLALSRRGHIKREPTAVAPLVHQAVGQLSPFPATLVLEVDLPADLFPVDGSGAQILRVVLNLVSNAREAMGDVGILKLKAENLYVDAPVSGYEAIHVGEYVRLQVTDSGSGMSAEIRDKIFEPFFTTKSADRRRGSGLGLSVVQAIVHDHNGYLDLESQPGKGTTFSVYLPISRKAVDTDRAEEIKEGAGSVLIVDDDELQHEVAGRILRVLGYTVSVVSSGEKAVDYLREQPVDLVLLDMIMPGGWDGLDTYRKMLEVRPGQKAIIVSGYADSERVQRVQALGAGAFLRKPATMKRLAQAVRDEMEDRSTPDGPGVGEGRLTT